MRTLLRVPAPGGRTLLAAAALLLCAALPVLAQTPALSPGNLGRLERGGGPLPQGHAVAVCYEGTLDLEGHYERPHASRPFHSLRRIAIAAPLLARQDWTTWSDADTSRSTETTLLLGERVLQRDHDGAPFRELRGREAGEAMHVILGAAPALAAARLRSLNGRGLEGGAASQYLTTFRWPDSLGRSEWNLDPFDVPMTYDALRDDPRRGTVMAGTRVFGTTTIEGRVWPDSLRTQGFPEGVSWVLREHRIDVDENVPLAELAAPEHVEPAVPSAPDTAARLSAVARGVWAIELPDADTRSLAVEFSDHLALLETSCDGVHGERLRAVLAARFPAKPVRVVAFSHYHPDYTGGLRPFIADSATVVCASALVPFVTEIAQAYFGSFPDRLWRLRANGYVPKADTLVAGRWRHADASNELVALDIGQASHHTDHYLVFWLPRQKLLFEGDLGFFTRDGALRPSSRAEGMLSALAAAKIVPTTVVQSWPVQGNAPSVPFETLRALVAARPKHE